MTSRYGAGVDLPQQASAPGTPPEGRRLLYARADGWYDLAPGGIEVALSVVGHTHDDRYYTRTETATLLSGKADTTHTHDGTAIATGRVAPARLGSGTADATTYLRGDGAWTTTPKEVLVLGPTDPVPQGTPSGTVIVRKTA